MECARIVEIRTLQAGRIGITAKRFEFGAAKILNADEKDGIRKCRFVAELIAEDGMRPVCTDRSAADFIADRSAQHLLKNRTRLPRWAIGAVQQNPERRMD